MHLRHCVQRRAGRQRQSSHRDILDAPVKLDRVLELRAARRAGVKGMRGRKLQVASLLHQLGAAAGSALGRLACVAVTQRKCLKNLVA